MARTELTKTIVENVTTITCDVCGGEVTDYWHMTSYYNGVNYEYTSPLDLCNKHIDHYESALQVLPYPFKYMKERYDPKCSDEDIKVLLNKILEINESEN